jgi:hypothetical protein
MRDQPAALVRRHLQHSSRELDVAGYEIVKKPGNTGFTFDTSGGDGAV